MMEDLSVIDDNLEVIRENITKSKSDPNQPVTLIAVSKIQSEEKIIRAYQAGQRDFGENYVGFVFIFCFSFFSYFVLFFYRFKSFIAKQTILKFKQNVLKFVGI